MSDTSKTNINEQSQVDIQSTDSEKLEGSLVIAVISAAYVLVQILSLNFYPLDAWTQRIFHLVGGLMIGAFIFSASKKDKANPLKMGLAILALLLSMSTVIAYFTLDKALFDVDEMNYFFWLIGIATVSTTVLSWWIEEKSAKLLINLALAFLCFIVGYYLIEYLDDLQFRGGAFPTLSDSIVSAVGLVLLLEITRRTAGLAMVIIAAVFIAYSFLGPWMPGLLKHSGYDAGRLVSYLLTDNGVLGPVLGVSATYLILFIVFAAFLQLSGAGDYFVKLAFSVAGHKKGGPAKVAVLASGLMGMINGSSAGNVVSTGAFTIPLMKRVGYTPPVAGAIEAAASSGGQILPPIMGAGAFIMADITGIPYTDIVVAATIPGILYFLSIFFMVDQEATKKNMVGIPKNQLPNMAKLIKQLYLFVPIIILITSLFMGYSVIRAGTLSGLSVIFVSWFGGQKMGPVRIFHAFALAGKMVIPLMSVCATAGIIVGVISITGVGLRLSSIMVLVAESSQLLALVFAMGISIILGMGMPTTAAYAVAAAVIAPGLIQLGLTPIVAHFFVFFYAVMSAITPPVALASFAGAAISGANAMQTAVQSFKIGISAFIIPFMFYFSPVLLMQGSTMEIMLAFVSAVVGIYLLSSAVQGVFWGKITTGLLRILIFAAAILMILSGWQTDLIGMACIAAIFFIQKQFTIKPNNIEVAK